MDAKRQALLDAARAIAATDPWWEVDEPNGSVWECAFCHEVERVHPSAFAHNLSCEWARLVEALDAFKDESSAHDPAPEPAPDHGGATAHHVDPFTSPEERT